MAVLTCTPAPSAQVEAEQLEHRWQQAPSLAILRRAAELARVLPFEQQQAWSGRARAAGLWHLCPLIATAQDASLPPLERARAAAAAWGTDRDCQARAVLRQLAPLLAPNEQAEVARLMSPEAADELSNLPRVWSVTPFFNELEILEARLTEMARAVDVFVILEAPRTFRGTPKPLYFADNRERFRRWAAQIEHCVVDLPVSDDPWVPEHYQRDVAAGELARLGARPSDLVLSTDLDEVVRADKVPAVLEATASSPVCLAMTMFWYSTEWSSRVYWAHPKGFRFGQVPTTSTYSDLRAFFSLPVVYDAGWHLSWFGGPERFDIKISSYAHAEADTPENHDRSYQERLMRDGIATTGEELLFRREHLPASMACLFKAAAP